MIDYYGRWTWEPSLPKEKWCDCDLVANWICETGYKVKTTIEDLVGLILLYFNSSDTREEYGGKFTLESCKQYVEDSGGLREFDYYIYS